MKKFALLLVLSRLLSASLAIVFNENKLSSIVDGSEFSPSVSRCTEISAAALFSVYNDLTLVVSDASRRSTDIANEILQRRFSDRTVKVSTKFSAPATGRSDAPPMRDSSFVVIVSYSNLSDLMLGSSVERWAEYIVVTEATISWISNFANVLRKNKFRNVAFVRVSSEGRGTLVHPIENPSSPDLPPILRNLDICDESDRLFSRDKKPSVVLPFSYWLLYPTNRTVRFARILEGTEDPKKFDAIVDGAATSFGVDVLRIFTKRRNIKLERYEWPNQSESTWTEAMERCLNEEFDFFYAVLPPSARSADGNLDAVAWYKHERLTFVDAVRKIDLTLSDIFIPFHSIVWICTVALFALFAAFAYAIDTLWKGGLIRERITILTIWSIFVGHTLRKVPVKFGLRFVLGMWLVHNLMRNAGYSALFSTSLTATDDSYFLKTFQDILDSGRNICGSSKSRELLNDTKDPVVYGIFKRLIPIPPMKVFEAIFNEGCIGTRHLTYISKHNMETRANESLRLYVPGKATIINYPSFYFAKKRNPYTKELKRTLFRAHEVGLVKWESEKYTVKLGKTSVETPMSSDAGLLKLEHLLILFKMLLVGHFASILVLILEICVYAWSARKHAERTNFTFSRFSRRR